jgi:hypothetical protein
VRLGITWFCTGIWGEAAAGRRVATVRGSHERGAPTKGVGGGRGGGASDSPMDRGCGLNIQGWSIEDSRSQVCATGPHGRRLSLKASRLDLNRCRKFVSTGQTNSNSLIFSYKQSQADSEFLQTITE